MQHALCSRGYHSSSSFQIPHVMSADRTAEVDESRLFVPDPSTQRDKEREIFEHFNLSGHTLELGKGFPRSVHWTSDEDSDIRWSRLFASITQLLWKWGRIGSSSIKSTCRRWPSWSTMCMSQKRWSALVNWFTTIRRTIESPFAWRSGSADSRTGNFSRYVLLEEGYDVLGKYQGCMNRYLLRAKFLVAFNGIGKFEKKDCSLTDNCSSVVRGSSRSDA